jgi:hypothetical protein
MEKVIHAVETFFHTVEVPDFSAERKLRLDASPADDYRKVLLSAQACVSVPPESERRAKIAAVSRGIKLAAKNEGKSRIGHWTRR